MPCSFFSFFVRSGTALVPIAYSLSNLRAAGAKRVGQVDDAHLLVCEKSFIPFESVCTLIVGAHKQAIKMKLLPRRTVFHLCIDNFIHIFAGGNNLLPFCKWNKRFLPLPFPAVMDAYYIFPFTCMSFNALIRMVLSSGHKWPICPTRKTLLFKSPPFGQIQMP